MINQQAAERLRRINAGEDREVVYGPRPDSQGSDAPQRNWEWQFEQCIADLDTVAKERLRELDPTPVDEAFADKFSIAKRELPWSLLVYWKIDDRLSVKKDHDLLSLTFNGYAPIESPTIGDFWTACRLFKVQLKEGVANV